MSCHSCVMLDIAGTSPDDEDRALLMHPATAGLILFARNYHNKDQLRALTAEVRALRPDLLIAVDQEGGRVQRFRDGFTRLPPMAALGRMAASSPAQALRAAELLGALMAQELVTCGVDLSFAPVLDLDYGSSAVIGDRSFSASPQQVIELAGAWITGMRTVGMAATGKHFPGHGFVSEDSHETLPVDARPLAVIQERDLLPFRALAGVLAGIMPAHVIYSQIDHQPAGFSRIWLQDILRNQLGFQGVIFSDDLSMGGAEIAGGYAARTQAALSAGCDMVLVCNNRPAAIEVLEAVVSMRLPPIRSAVSLQAARLPVMSKARYDAALQLAHQLSGED